MQKFQSKFTKIGAVDLPEFSGTRIMMMPFVIGERETIPEDLAQWRQTVDALSTLSGYEGQVGYLTIDEREVTPGASHRRSGLHVDGVYANGAGGWGGGGWGGRGRPMPAPCPSISAIPECEYGTGFLTVSSHIGCRAWQGEFQSWPGAEGECDHMADECREEEGVLFEPHTVYWVSPLCVHESLPLQQATKRQFVRLSLPSEAPWFEGYTKNSLGIMPTGPVLAPRPAEYMRA